MMPSQPEVNIGMVGHVDHGKSTLTKALTGSWTDRHSEEIKRGISIKLGYADAAFYKCPNCSEPGCYNSNNAVCQGCKSKCELLRVVSFVDAPGHEALMAVMLSGAALMDGALLLIAADELCPQPQTREHLMALEITGIKNLVIVQNKIDLVNESQAFDSFNQIKDFVKGTIAENAPIIPISAHHEANLDVLIQQIQERIPTPERDTVSSPIMFCSRSFDVNKPGTDVHKLVGGVLGGSLLRGKLRVRDEIEILPGRKVEEKGKTIWEPLYSEIASLFSGKFLEEAMPSGLLAVGTKLDPSFLKSDAIVGSVIGKPGSLPPAKDELSIEVNLLEKVVGVLKEKEVSPLKVSENLMLTVGTATGVGQVSSIKRDIADIKLRFPVCSTSDQRVAISRLVEGRWHLIGYGITK
jgi:translation initiation factor 2 subunit 3